MGQFKPMVKMETTEPSVILKLKKGGKVNRMVSMNSGHKAMAGKNIFSASEQGMAPKKPSMSARRKAMNPQMYAKGGNVAHKMGGGGMGMPAGMPPAMPARMPQPMAPMGRQAAMGMPADARAARMMALRKAISGMKKGGSADAKCAALERELKHHESMPASKAHNKASGGTIKGNANKFANTKVDDGDKHDSAKGTGSVQNGKPAGYKLGGTIAGNVSKYANTKVVDGDRHDSASGTGGVRMGNAGGFKKGGNVSSWENRPADTTPRGKSNTSTGNVKLGAGGYKMGGAAKKAYATGGNVVDDGKAVKMPNHFVSKPVANSMQSGTFAKGGNVKEEKPNLRLIKTHKGPSGHVAKVYKDRDWDEHRVKFFSPEGQHHPNADYHTETAEDAHDTAMRQVSHGYRKGGNVKRFEDGGSDKQAQMNQKGVDATKKFETSDNKSLREYTNPMRIIQPVIDKFFPSKPAAGAVTKTKESVTVNPKMHGGSAKYAKGGDVNWTKLNPTLKDKYNRVNEPVYSSSAVDKSIDSSNRSGRKIGSSEASSIHRLLKGRS